MANSSFKDTLQTLEDTGRQYLVKQAPPLPENIQSVVVAIAPWLALIGVILGVLAIPVLLVALGIGTFMAPMHIATGTTPLAMIALVIGIAATVLEAFALRGLFNKTHQGWQYMTYARLLGLVSSALSLSVVGLVIGIAVLYLWFQVEKHYK